MRPETPLSETLRFTFHGNAPTKVSVFARVHLGNLHLLYCAVTGLASRSISVKCDPRTLFQSPYSSRFTETLLLKLASSRGCIFEICTYYTAQSLGLLVGAFP